MLLSKLTPMAPPWQHGSSRSTTAIDANRALVYGEGVLQPHVFELHKHSDDKRRHRSFPTIIHAITEYAVFVIYLNQSIAVVRLKAPSSDTDHTWDTFRLGDHKSSKKDTGIRKPRWLHILSHERSLTWHVLFPLFILILIMVRLLLQLEDSENEPCRPTKGSRFQALKSEDFQNF